MPSPEPVAAPSLGSQLRAWRVAEELSQEAAAQRIGVTQAAWSKWELDQRVPDDVRHLLWLEVHAGLPLEAWSSMREEAAALLAAVIAARTLAAAPGPGVVERALASVDALRASTLAAVDVLRAELQAELSAIRRDARARTRARGGQRAA